MTNPRRIHSSCMHTDDWLMSCTCASDRHPNHLASSLIYTAISAATNLWQHPRAIIPYRTLRIIILDLDYDTLSLIASEKITMYTRTLYFSNMHACRDDVSIFYMLIFFQMITLQLRHLLTGVIYISKLIYCTIQYRRSKQSVSCSCKSAKSFTQKAKNMLQETW